MPLLAAKESTASSALVRAQSLMIAIVERSAADSPDADAETDHHVQQRAMGQNLLLHSCGKYGA